MNQLNNISLNDDQEPVISGRQLHEALEVKTSYDKWFPRMTEYGFTENEDFSTFLSKSTGGLRATDHVIKLDMAKEKRMWAELFLFVAMRVLNSQDNRDVILSRTVVATPNGERKTTYILEVYMEE